MTPNAASCKMLANFGTSFDMWTAGARAKFPNRNGNMIYWPVFGSHLNEPISNFDTYTHTHTHSWQMNGNGFELKMQMGKTENHLTKRQTVLSIWSIQFVAEIMIIRICLVEME